MRFANTPPTFDYKAQRLMLGIIALILPFLVTAIAGRALPSISASYFTDARNWFVGLLFIVGGLMFTYNGHTNTESIASKTAALASVAVALFPTSEATCSSSPTSAIHTTAAVIMFLILAYFCFGPFRERTKGQSGKKGRRAKLYFVCGSIIGLSMLVGLIGAVFFDCETTTKIELTYWVETFALIAFGVAWIVSGKVIPWLVDQDEALKVFQK